MRRGRRSEPDPLEPVDALTWLVMSEFRENLEVTPLAPMTDFRSILAAKREALKAEGWAVEPMGARSASFFCSKDGHRVLVAIYRMDPSKSTVGHH
jgi:hypothetical protein